MSQSKSDKKASRKTKSENKPGMATGWVRMALIIFVLALYGNTTNYQYTLDDDIFYLKHNSVQKGVSGLSEFFSYGSMEKFDGTLGEQPYRPVTLLSFAIEKDLFNNKAASSHFINILLYILVLQVLLSLMLRLFPRINPMLSAAVVLLFAAHPIHTEVVASVKSRDELLAGLFGLMAWLYALPKPKEEFVSIKSLSTGLFFFGLAIFSKESAVAFILVIPLSYYMLVSSNLNSTLKNGAGFFAIGILFVILRMNVIGHAETISNTEVHENILKNTQGLGEATATRMEILFHYIKLLVVPWPLSWDYSFNQIPIMNWTDVIPWISFLLYTGLLISAFYYFKKKPILSFAIFFFFITLSPTSNILFINLSTLGERFLFIPSLGFILALVFLLSELFKLDTSNFSGPGKKMFRNIILALLVIYSGLSFSRSSDWKSNLTLFESGVKNSPNSSRAHYSLATEYARQADASADVKSRREYLSKAISHFNTSLDIWPKNVMSLYNLANTQCAVNDTSGALINYKKAVNINPSHLGVLNNIGGVYMSRSQPDSALLYLKEGYEYNQKDINLIANIALVSYFSKDYSQAIDFANKAIALDPKNKKSYNVLIDSYTALGQTEQANRFRKARDTNFR
ncbi:MAG: hypothetical protein EYC69_07025 [Bacteroidetes bacterium]|nr:MAG: hypothetical protein EYC69_07025 [Bacteroidota bacterium]